MQEKRLYSGLVTTVALEQCDVFEGVMWRGNKIIDMKSKKEEILFTVAKRPLERKPG